MIKACKVISLWPSLPRHSGTNSPQSLEDWKRIISLSFESEKEVDPGWGVALDVYFVVNTLSDNSEHHEIADEVRELYHNKKVRKGKVFVHQRENTGNGFDGLKYILEKHKDDYEYWCYQEDDHYMLPGSANGYFLQSIKQLKANEKLRAISFTPIKTGPDYHWGAVYGVYHRDSLCLDTWPVMRATGEAVMAGWIAGDYEAIELIKGYANCPRSWEKLRTYQACVEQQLVPKFRKENKTDDPYFFTVGIED